MARRRLCLCLQGEQLTVWSARLCVLNEQHISTHWILDPPACGDAPTFPPLPPHTFLSLQLYFWEGCEGSTPSVSCPMLLPSGALLSCLVSLCPRTGICKVLSHYFLFHYPMTLWCAHFDLIFLTSRLQTRESLQSGMSQSYGSQTQQCKGAYTSQLEEGRIGKAQRAKGLDAARCRGPKSSRAAALCSLPGGSLHYSRAHCRETAHPTGLTEPAAE